MIHALPKLSGVENRGAGAQDLGRLRQLLSSCRPRPGAGLGFPVYTVYRGASAPQLPAGPPPKGVLWTDEIMDARAFVNCKAQPNAGDSCCYLCHTPGEPRCPPTAPPTGGGPGAGPAARAFSVLPGCGGPSSGRKAPRAQGKFWGGGEPAPRGPVLPPPQPSARPSECPQRSRLPRKDLTRGFLQLCRRGSSPPPPPAGPPRPSRPLRAPRRARSLLGALCSPWRGDGAHGSRRAHRGPPGSRVCCGDQGDRPRVRPSQGYSCPAQEAEDWLGWASALSQ